MPSMRPYLSLPRLSQLTERLATSAARRSAAAEPHFQEPIERRPQVCLIDGLAWDNPPGSRHASRYEDVQEILDAGISVITSLNLEYIAEEQDFIVKLVVTGEDRPGMLADVANAITSTGTNVTEAGMRGVDGNAVGTFLIQIKNLNQLNKVVTTVRKVRGVQDVERATLAGEDEG